MMRFEKLIVTFVDMMDADGYSVLRIQKPDTHTYIIKLRSSDEQAFEYIHGAARFIEEYYTRISVEYQDSSVTGENNIITRVFKEDAE